MDVCWMRLVLGMEKKKISSAMIFFLLCLWGFFMTGCHLGDVGLDDLGTTNPSDGEQGAWTQGFESPGPHPVPNTCDAAFRWNGDFPVEMGEENAPGVGLQVGVDERGGALMQLSLDVPGGSQGMAPSLGVQCSDQGESLGLFGKGCQLSGLQFITRCGRQRGVDGTWGGINWNNNDRLCLGGSMLWTEEESYWNAQEYHPVDQPDTRVFSERDHAGRIVGFREETQGGEIRYYGGDGQGTFVEGPDQGTNTLPAYMYRLHKVLNREGVGIEYSYNLEQVQRARDLQRGLAVATMSRPSRVLWSFREVAGQRVMNPEFEAEFVFEEDAEDTVGRVGYVGGMHVLDKGVVGNFVVREVASGEEVWRYRFGYEQDENEQEVEIGRLQTVRKCIGANWTGTGQEICSKPRVLAYTEKESGHFTKVELQDQNVGRVRYYPSSPEGWKFSLELGQNMFAFVGPSSLVINDVAHGGPVDREDGGVAIGVEVRDEAQCWSGDWEPIVQEVPWGGERIIHVNPRAKRWNVIECSAEGQCAERATGVPASIRYTGVTDQQICTFGASGAGEIRYADLDRDGVAELYIESSEPERKDRHWLWLKPDEEAGLVSVRTDIAVATNMRQNWIDWDGDGLLDRVEKKEGSQGRLVLQLQNLEMPESQWNMGAHVQEESWLSGGKKNYLIDRAGSYEDFAKARFGYGDINGDGKADLYDPKCGNEERAWIVSHAEEGTGEAGEIGYGKLEAETTDFKICPQMFSTENSGSEEVTTRHGDGDLSVTKYMYGSKVIHLNDDGYPDLMRLTGEGAQSVEVQLQKGNGKVSDWYQVTIPDVEAGAVRPGLKQFRLYGSLAIMRIQSFREGFVAPYGEKSGLWLPGLNADNNGEWFVLVGEHEQVHVVNTGIPYVRKDDTQIPGGVNLGIPANDDERSTRIRLLKAERQARVRKLALVDMDGDGHKDVHTILNNEGHHQLYYYDENARMFKESYVDYRENVGQRAFSTGEKQDWVEVLYGLGKQPKIRPAELGEVRGAPGGGHIIQRRQFLEAESEDVYEPWEPSERSRKAGVTPISGEGLILVSSLRRHTGMNDEQGQEVIAKTRYQWGGMGFHASSRSLVLPKWKKVANLLTQQVDYVERGKQFEPLGMQEGAQELDDDIFEGARGQLIYGTVPTYTRSSIVLNHGQEIILREEFVREFQHRSRWGGRAGQLEPVMEESQERFVDGPRAGEVYKINRVQSAYGRDGELLSEEKKVFFIDGAGGEQLKHRSFILNTYARQGLLKWLKLPLQTVRSEWEPEGEHAAGGDAEIRTTLFEYDEVSAQIIKKTEEPRDDELRRVVEFVYTAEGLLHETWQGHSDGQHRRLLSRQHWDERGKHVVCEENALGHTEKFAHHPVLGSVIKRQGPNRLVSAVGMDFWGREHWSRAADGAVSKTFYNVERTENRGVKYPLVVEKRSAGLGRSVEKYNGAGQVIHSRVQQHRGQWVWEDVAYNDKGGVSKKYGPYRMTLCGQRAIGDDGQPVDAQFNDVPFEDAQNVGSWCSVNGGEVPVSQFFYDRFGRQVKVRLPNGAESRTEYSGLEVQNINALGRARKTRKNALGRVVVVQDPRVNLRAVFDEETGELKLEGMAQGEAAEEAGCVVRYSYDVLGRISQVQICDETHETRFGYNKYGEKTWIESPDSGRILYGYNGYGELSWTEDALLQKSWNLYDVLGRKVLEVRPEGVNRWEYDTAPGAGLGKLASSKSLDGIVYRYRYDDVGRVIETQIELESGEVWSKLLRYDPQGRLLSEERRWLGQDGEPKGSGWLSVHYGYESGLNNLYGGQLETVHIERLNQDGVVQGFGDRELIWRLEELNAFGQVQADRFGNGIQGHYAHDSKTGALQWIQTGLFGLGGAGNRVLTQDKSFEYDALMQLSMEKDALFGSEKRYVYDELNRLVGVFESEGSTAKSELYGYDQWGNLQDKQIGQYERMGENRWSNEVRKQFRFAYEENREEAEVLNGGPHAVREVSVLESRRNALGELEGGDEEVWAMEYDAAGSMISYSGNLLLNRDKRFNFTSFYKPREVEQGPVVGHGVRHRMQYDANGNRVQKRILSEGDPAVGVLEVAEELTQLGGYERTEKFREPMVHKHFIHVPGKGVVAMLKEEEPPLENPLDEQNAEADNTQTLLFMHLGRQGSVDALTNDAGNVVELPRYETWGESVEGTLQESPLGYTGHRHDLDLGLIDMNARYYIPEIHRFASADTIVPDAGNSQAYNRYSYVLNNPNQYTDPTGHAPVDQLGAVAYGAQTDWYASNGADAIYTYNLFQMGTVPEINLTVEYSPFAQQTLSNLSKYGRFRNVPSEEGLVRSSVQGWYESWVTRLANARDSGNSLAQERLAELRHQAEMFGGKIPIIVAVDFVSARDKGDYPPFKPGVIGVDFNVIQALMDKVKHPDVGFAVLEMHLGLALSHPGVDFVQETLMPMVYDSQRRVLIQGEPQGHVGALVDAVGYAYMQAIQSNGIPTARRILGTLSPDMLGEFMNIEPDFWSLRRALDYADASGTINRVPVEEGESSDAFKYGSEIYQRGLSCAMGLLGCHAGQPGFWSRERVRELLEAAKRQGIRYEKKD